MLRLCPAAAALSLFLGLSLRAAETKPVAKPPEAKVDKALAHAETTGHPHGFHLDAGASALFFNPPEKDSFPLYNNAPAFDEATQSGMRFDSSSVTVLPRFALGYEFERSDTPGLLGEDLKVEFSTSSPRQHAQLDWRR